MTPDLSPIVIALIAIPVAFIFTLMIGLAVGDYLATRDAPDEPDDRVSAIETHEERLKRISKLPR